MRFSLLALLLLAACAGQNEKPKSVEELGVATPAHPVNYPAKIETPPGAPMQMPVPNTAVPRATDAGASDEGGPIATKE